MARRKFASPTLEIQITPENHERAVKSASGGCLIADAIKEQYPHLTKVTVDMATIRASDRAQGVRYTYLTPPVAQHLLLGFDQGWPQVADHLILRRAVQIAPITRAKAGRNSTAGAAARRQARIMEFEQRIAKGDELMPNERRALAQLRNARPAPERPSSPGRPEVRVEAQRGTVVEGGRPPLQGPAHPNLLRRRDRHFGARLADPGQAFTDAVEVAVAERLAEAAK